MKRALFLLVVVCLLVVAGCGGPEKEQQERWANAACDVHGGIAHFDDFDDGGGGDGPTNVLCKDGRFFTQLSFETDSGRGEEWGWETPAEVRERSKEVPAP